MKQIQEATPYTLNTVRENYTQNRLNLRMLRIPTRAQKPTAIICAHQKILLSMGFNLTCCPWDSKCHFSVPSGRISLHHLRPTRSLKLKNCQPICYLPETFFTVQKSKAANKIVIMKDMTSSLIMLFKKR